MYHQHQSSPLAPQSISGQRWVDLAFILALISIVVVVALSLLGPAIGNTVAASSGADSPAPAITNTHPESSAAAPALFDMDANTIENVNSAPR